MAYSSSSTAVHSAHKYMLLYHYGSHGSAPPVVQINKLARHSASPAAMIGQLLFVSLAPLCGFGIWRYTRLFRSRYPAVGVGWTAFWRGSECTPGNPQQDIFIFPTPLAPGQIPLHNQRSRAIRDPEIQIQTSWTRCLPGSHLCMYTQRYTAVAFWGLQTEDTAARQIILISSLFYP